MDMDAKHALPRVQTEEDQRAGDELQFETLRIEVSDIAAAVHVDAATKIAIEHVNFYFGAKQALFTISLPVRERQVTALIGPSGSGKTTFLRTLNRMSDQIAGTRIEGRAIMDGENIYDPARNLVQLRQQIGMVFQRPNPFPGSIFDNIAYALRAQKQARSVIQEMIEQSLRGAALWEEVKDRLHAPAQSLSGGQQQRLCIARAIAARPKVLLMDEPTSALDPIATFSIEELMTQLQQDYTIVIVTHNMQQAARVSQFAGFFLAGHLMEFAPTTELFTHPKQRETEQYISGRFG